MLIVMAKAEKVVPTAIQFVDIAGLVRGASKGEGLGNQFLSHIREVDAIVQVARCFEDSNVIHVENKVDPVADIQTVTTELCLKDLDTVQKRLERARKLGKGAGPAIERLAVEICEGLVKHLDEAKPARSFKLPDAVDAHIVLRDMQLLTAKPAFYVANVAEALAAALPQATIIPAHPVAGTEKSGPDAGFATLFQGRWCILTPPANAPEAAVAALSSFWQRLGADVEIMDARHHDLVLAVTSHLPHLIAYTIVGTADDLEEVTQSEVIKYSAGGFRDFTRIAASDPVMWRDVFLNNREAVLEMLQRFSEDLTALQRAIRYGKGDDLEALFARTRDIRRSIVEQGQDDDAPDFGRKH